MVQENSFTTNDTNVPRREKTINFALFFSLTLFTLVIYLVFSLTLFIIVIYLFLKTIVIYDLFF